jgi:hypothetical protein
VQGLGHEKPDTYSSEYVEVSFLLENDAKVSDRSPQENGQRRTGLLIPRPVDFADVLHPTHTANDPSDIVRDRDHP